MEDNLLSKNCNICDYEMKSMNFTIEKSVSSDARLIDHAISHSYCCRCGYISIDIKNRIDYHKFYISDYDFLLDGDIEPTMGEIKYSEYLVDFYAEYLENDKVKSFFDIGGGKGNFINAVHKKFPDLQCSALEPSKSFEVLKTKEFLIEKYNDFFEAKNFNNKYDFISIIGVLEHVPDPQLFLQDIKKIMTDNSYLLIEVPNFKNNKSDLLTIDHLSKFAEESIENLFLSTGFTIVKKQLLPTVPMQYIVKIGKKKNIQQINISKDIDNAVNYLTQAFGDANLLANKKVAIYGQGLVMEYLLGVKIFDIENISCIIDDNALYQGKKWKNSLDIVDFDTFKKEYNTKYVYLAMNDCYHEIVLNKLDSYTVLGILK